MSVSILKIPHVSLEWRNNSLKVRHYCFHDCRTGPVIRWEQPTVSVTEGGSTEACFVSDIGSVEPYDVIVGVRESVPSPATSMQLFKITKEGKN